MKKRLVLIGALCGWCTALSAGTLETMEIEVGGEERHFMLFTPKFLRCRSANSLGVRYPRIHFFR